MGFSKMMELLQVKHKGKIVICNAGNFYIAIGSDAIFLNGLIHLKLSCLKPEVCKVGFPINSLEKYTNLIQEKGYSYIVYNFDRTNEELKIIKEYKGTNEKNLEKQRANCYICKHNTKFYKKDDKYIEALAKLYEKENIEESKKEKLNNKKEEKNKWFKIKKKKTN